MSRIRPAHLTALAAAAAFALSGCGSATSDDVAAASSTADSMTSDPCPVDFPWSDFPGSPDRADSSPAERG